MSFPRAVPGQHPTGQFREGQNSMRQRGFSGDQQHLNSRDQPSYEQLAFYSIHKPLDATSWDDARPIHHRLSASDIRKALAKLHQNPRDTVKDTLMSLKSDSARRLIHALVQEQNEKLLDSDRTSEWIIAGIDTQKEIVKQWPSQKKIIKSIEVILKTEPTPFNTQDFDDDPFGPPSLEEQFEAGGARNNQVHRDVHQHGPIVHAEPQVILPPPVGHHLIQMDSREGGDHRHGNQEFPPPHPPQNGQRGHTHGQGGQGGHHHGQQPHGIAPGPPHPSLLPPPPPLDTPLKHTKVVLPQFDTQKQPVPMQNNFQETRPAPQFMPAQILDPQVIKYQKSKSKNLRRELQDIYELEFESGSESSNSEIGSQFSSRSVEDGAYGIIERSRSRSRNVSKTRSRGRGAVRSRSNGRDRIPKLLKVKKSHGPSRSDVEVVHEDKHSPPFKNSSLRSSASALPTQQIFNIYIDNDNDREREQKSDRGGDGHTTDYDPRRNSKPIPSSGFSKPMYTKRDKLHAHPVSRQSSVGGSDTGSSVIDGNSSIYTSDDSVFSEPVRSRMYSRTASEVGGGVAHLRSRNLPTPRQDALMPAYHESHQRQKPHFEVDDCPPQRPRGSLQEGYVEPHRSPSYRQPSLATRRHSVQLANPFDPRYPAQPSRSYTEYSRQLLPQRYIAESRPEPFEIRAMTDQLGAMDYINHSRRGGLPHRRNNLRGRMALEVDEWAYRPHGRVYDGYRHM